MIVERFGWKMSVLLMFFHFAKELTKASVLAITHAQNKSAARRKRTSVEP